MPAGTIEKLVKNTIERNNLLKKGDSVIIGLSGGPDSVCLFSVLLALRYELELNIKAVHVNHMLRPGAADDDQKYVEVLCRKSGIDCDVSIQDCAKAAKEQGVTDEEAGRNIRYAAFYSAAKEWMDAGIPAVKIKIAVAQNKNDQAETLLMRIMRGTGTNGLAGIAYQRAGQYGTSVIRPLLDAERAEILDYCREKNLAPCMDHTNEKPLYTRNKVRLELLSYLADEYNENIVDALHRLAQSAREDNLYLREQAEAVYASLKTTEIEPNVRFRRSVAVPTPEAEEGNCTSATAEKRVALARCKLQETAPAIRHRVVLMAFQEIGLMQDISAAHLSMIDKLLMSKSASAAVNLPEGYMMSVSYGTAFASIATPMLAKIEAPEAWNINILPDGAEVASIASPMSAKIEASETWNINILPDGASASSMLKNKNAVSLDYRKIKEVIADTGQKIEIRRRKPGDYFTPQGMKMGKKKIQDYFVDRKIPKYDRDLYSLAVLGHEVVCVFAPFHVRHNEISEKYKVTGDTKEVLMLEMCQKS